MSRLPVLIAIVLLLSLCVVMASYLVIYNFSYELEYKEIDIEETSYENGVLTITLKASMEGEYLYRVIGAPNEKGEYELTFRGGKQPALAQTPGESLATFTVEIPAGYTKVVCDKSILHSISTEGEE